MSTSPPYIPPIPYQVGGRIIASNSPAIAGTILSVVSNANLKGNIHVNGNIVVSGGTIAGIVTHPPNTTYNGPKPAANIEGVPALRDFPALPPIYEIQRL